MSHSQGYYGDSTQVSQLRSIGAITEMRQFAASIGHLTSMQQGVYVASFLLSSAVSSLASGHISDRISRRYGILLGGILSLIGTVISASSPNFASLIVARLITGMGAGQGISVATVYLIEIATVDIRGVTACSLQFFIVIGIALGYFIAYAAHTLPGTMAWRLLFIIQAAVAAVLSLGALFLPFSPRWLVQVGRIDQARLTLSKLRPKGDAVNLELEDIQQSLRSDNQTKLASWKEIFGKKYIKQTSLGLFLMSFQQLTGIDVVLYYAPIIFQQTGFTSEKASFLSSGVTGIVMLVSTIPAQIWIDRWGRRMPLIIGGLLITACFIVTGTLYEIFGRKTGDSVVLCSDTAQWVIIVLIYVYVASFAWSWGVVGRIYAAEIIPTRLRAKVCALEQVANWVVNFLVTFTAPLFLRTSPSGPYFLYGFSTLVAVVVCYLMPETKGRTLESIEYLFEKGGKERSQR
ncbi:hypothetical protein AJ79_05151 [Helicocarpus griseus UAMH5409]|uniref:Major facilitator superfamily (MFS) profile domain-containing protein n=1 Tax=Helicocarpus griseus UAMH5409 TaxID=1447875 RepID=A0A2B7XPX2_9EURO|nr:hypothetical protein AJ79_05151 [Helicocarpus griseus UAMH5409]